MRMLDSCVFIHRLYVISHFESTLSDLYHIGQGYTFGQTMLRWYSQGEDDVSLRICVLADLGRLVSSL